MAIAPAPLLLSPAPAAQPKGNRPAGSDGGNARFAAMMVAATSSEQASSQKPFGLSAGSPSAPKAAAPAAESNNHSNNSRPAEASTGQPARSTTRPQASKPPAIGNSKGSTNCKPTTAEQPASAAPAQTEAPLEDSAPTKTTVRARTRAEASEDPTAAPPADLALLANPLPLDPAVMAQLNLGQAARPAQADALDTTNATQALASADGPGVALRGATGTGLDSKGQAAGALADVPLATGLADGPAPVDDLVAGSMTLPTPGFPPGPDTGSRLATSAAAGPAASSGATAQTAQTLATSARTTVSLPASRGAARAEAGAGAAQMLEPRTKATNTALREAAKATGELRPRTADGADEALTELQAPPAAQADTAPLSSPGLGIGLPLPLAAAATAAAGSGAPLTGADGWVAPAASAADAATNNPSIGLAGRSAAATGGATAATSPDIEGAAAGGPRRPASALRGNADGAASPPDANAPAASSTFTQLLPAANDNSAASQVALAQQLASPANTSPSRGSHEATGVAQASIDVPIDQPGFAPALGAQISVLAREGVQEAKLQLHPAEMGPITVQIAVDGTAARVEFQAEMATTRSAIEASLPALAGALQDAGLTLTGGGVFQQSPQSGQQQPEQSGRGAPAPGARRDARGDATALDAPAVRLASGRRGLVDLVA